MAQNFTRFSIRVPDLIPNHSRPDISEFAYGFHVLIPNFRFSFFFPQIDCDKSIVVHLKHDEKLLDNSEACFQCALLYTSQGGERRIRVHTLCLPTSTQLSSMYRGADLDTHVAVVLKKGDPSVLITMPPHQYKATPLFQSFEPPGSDNNDIIVDEYYLSVVRSPGWMDRWI